LFKKIIFTFFLFILTLNSFAFSPEERLENAKLENRAQELFLEIRCLVCSGQVIENSDTEFSLEMRKLIRKKIIQGKTNEKIKLELVAEFGEDILTSISGKKDQFTLYILPIFAMIIAFFVIIYHNFRNKK
jgi:cytochrome c-type biogenesis protein CcmH